MKIRVSIDAQSYEVEVGDLNARPILVTVEGETFEVLPEQEVESTAQSAPRSASIQRPAAPAPANGRGIGSGIGSGNSNGNGATGGGNTHPAPIPGVIISINVKEGDTVANGQELLVLEAMKMKNSIRANRSGKVRALRVAIGDQVRKGQVLIEYAD